MTRLTWASGLEPNWSPDGRLIAFDSYRDGRAGEIYRMRADGSGQTRLTNDWADDFRPAWSPDGRWLVFNQSLDGGPFDIARIRSNGSGRRINLTNSLSYEIAPDWQPLIGRDEDKGERE